MGLHAHHDLEFPALFAAAGWGCAGMGGEDRIRGLDYRDRWFGVGHDATTECSLGSRINFACSHPHGKGTVCRSYPMGDRLPASIALGIPLWSGASLPNLHVRDCSRGVNAPADDHRGDIDPFRRFHLVQHIRTRFNAHKFSCHHASRSARGRMPSVSPSRASFACASAHTRRGKTASS